MYHYIKFDFDLGYGYGLPVLIEIDKETKEKLQQYFQREYSDDDFISFDENYISVNPLIESAEFFETEIPLPLDFKSEYILNILLTYFERPFEFSEIELKQITNFDEINKIIELYTSNLNTVHELKIAPEYFEKVLSKEKTFECRYNDRNYQIGDILNLNEYQNQKYTGRSISVEITYILENFEGLKENFVILSIKHI